VLFAPKNKVVIWATCHWDAAQLALSRPDENLVLKARIATHISNHNLATCRLALRDEIRLLISEHRL
jgi:hypothetical protein